MNENEEYVLQLSDQRIDFKPVSKNVSVFYDESNRQVRDYSMNFFFISNFFNLNFLKKVFIVIDRGSEAIIVKNPDGFIMNFWYEIFG